MARAKKIGVDYYSHDVGAQKKQTVKALRSRFGNDGYAFWFILLELLGERDGLYMDCSDEATWIYLCTEVMIDEDKVTDMLNFLGRLGAIDKDLWAVDKIIWCQNFTDRLADVFKKRGVPKPEKPISKMVSATKTNISAPEMPISATEMRQSKVKESKVKNSKVTTTATTRARERKKSNVFFSFPIFLLFSSFSYLYRIITGKHVYKKNNARTICIRCTLYFQRHSLCPRESISQKGRRHHPFSETP